MPCYLLLLRKLGVKVPEDGEFLSWLERELMKRLGVNRHEELRRVLEEKAKKDSWGLKLLIEEMVAFYRLKTARKRRGVLGRGEEDQVQEQVYVV
jgi:hypothetical protein